MAITYEDIGFDRFLRRDFNPVAEVTEDEAQSRTPLIPQSVVKGDVPEKQIEKAVNNISRVSQTTTASAIGVLNGSVALLLSDIRDLTYPDKIMFAVPEITAYDGTLGSASAIIYPTTSWNIDRGFDFHFNNTNYNNGKSLTAFMAIGNQSGVTKNIYWYIRWRFVGTDTAAEQ